MSAILHPNNVFMFTNVVYPSVSGAWFLPPGSHTLMAPPSHQFQGSPGLGLAAPAHPCDRFSLRDHRHTPYSHPFSRRSPPHGKLKIERCLIELFYFVFDWSCDKVRFRFKISRCFLVVINRSLYITIWILPQQSPVSNGSIRNVSCVEDNRCMYCVNAA